MTTTALDPKLVTLAKAIRQQESGGDPTRTGASGEYGAYQFMPSTWNTYAKAAGVNVPLEKSTLQQQNEVAYKSLERMRREHPEWNVGNFASAWNAGEDEANAYMGTFKNGKPSRGKNDKGVAYDVPGYAKAVATYYQQFKAQGGQPQVSQETPQPQQPAVNVADQQGGQETGAWFPSSTTDQPLVAGLKAAGNLVPSAFRFAGGVVDTALHPIQAIENIVQHPVESLIPEGIRKAATGLAGMATGDRIGTAADLEQAQRQFVNDPFGTVAPAVLGARGLAGAVDAGTGALAKARMASYVENIGENTAKGVPIPRGGTNLGGAFDAGVSTIARPVVGVARTAFGKASDVARGGAQLTPEEAASKILLGKKDVTAGDIRGLSELETTGKRAVTTYDDAFQRIGQKIEENQAKTDVAYAQDKTPVKLKDLTQRSKGIAPINYVSEALTGLEEFYTKSRDVNGMTWTKNMLKKAKGVGLTPSEINMIAKKYGGEFGEKAFSRQTGEPLTSVNAQAYENVRSGIKTTARGLLKDDAAKLLDKQTSELISLQKKLKLVRDGVRGIERKIENRGLLEKAGRAAGIVLDAATLGFFRGFVQKFLIDSNLGNKTPNFIGIEARLNANLKRLKYLNGVSDSTLVRIMADAMKQVEKLPAPVREGAETYAKATTVFGRPTETAGR